MADEDPDLPQSIFGTKLLDVSGQPNLVIDSPECHQLIWDLVNPLEKPEDILVISPFQTRAVGPDQYHFVFKFDPGALTDVPTLQDWDVAVHKDNGAIDLLYVAYAKGTLTLGPLDSQKFPLTYTRAIQKDPNISTINVRLVAGPNNIMIGHKKVPDGTTYGPFDLTLVQANTPTLAAPPIAVDFIGRRTLINDGKTPNSFMFALTNMTQASLPLTPKQDLAVGTSPTTFTVWFDYGPSSGQNTNPTALTRLQNLTNDDAVLEPGVPNSKAPTNWTATKYKDLVPPQWKITVTEKMDLEPYTPVFFTFSGIVTDLEPGFTRMYLRFENLSVYPTGVLIAELEKTPLSYGTEAGKGLYLFAGMPSGDNLPIVDAESGLNVQKFGGGAAALFNGGAVGIDIGTTPETKLQIHDDYQGWKDGTLMLGPGDKTAGVTLRFGCQPDHSWIQAHDNKPLAINPLANNVGIGSKDPGSLLSVAGGVAIGKSFAHSTIIDGRLAVENIVAVGTTDPGSSLSVAGGVAIGKSYAERATIKMPDNDLAVEGSVGIGTNKPNNRLHVVSDNGIRLSLSKNGGGQLTVGNSKGDNSVYLIATGKDDPAPETSAALLWVGGYENPQNTLPKMILNAKEVDLQANATQISGRVGIGGAPDGQAPLSVQGDSGLHGNLYVDGAVMIDGSKYPVPYATSQLMIIQGVIWQVNTNNGLTYSIIGTGFKITTDLNQTGVWFINFDPPFSDQPAVVTTPQYFGNQGDSGYNTSFLTYTSKTEIRVRTSSLYYGKPAWNDFAFIAIGPR